MIKKIIKTPFAIKLLEEVFHYFKNYIYNLNDKKKIIGISLSICSYEYDLSFDKPRINLLLNMIKNNYSQLEDLVNLPNLGGNSLLSEALSALISLALFNVGYIVPEIEIKYEKNGMPKGDHLFWDISSKCWSIVSTTRVYNRNDDQYKLRLALKNKMMRLCYARDNLSKKEYNSGIRMFIHIFCKSNKMCKFIKETIIDIRRNNNEYRSCNLYEIEVIIIKCDIIEVFQDGDIIRKYIKIDSSDKYLFKKIHFNTIDDIISANSEIAEIYRRHYSGRLIGNEIVYSIDMTTNYRDNRILIKRLNTVAQLYHSLKKINETMILSDGHTIRYGLPDNLCLLSNEVSNLVQSSSDELMKLLLDY